MHEYTIEITAQREFAVGDILLALDRTAESLTELQQRVYIAAYNFLEEAIDEGNYEVSQGIFSMSVWTGRSGGRGGIMRHFEEPRYKMTLCLVAARRCLGGFALADLDFAIYDACKRYIDATVEVYSHTD